MRRDPIDAFGTLILAGALAFCLLFWTGVGVFVAWRVGAFDSSPPACTAGASSIELGRKAVTTWYPKGCRHG
jgi:hypothetical protein